MHLTYRNEGVSKQVSYLFVFCCCCFLSLFLRPVNQDGYIKARNDGQGNEERKQTNDNVHATGSMSWRRARDNLPGPFSSLPAAAATSSRSLRCMTSLPPRCGTLPGHWRARTARVHARGKSWPGSVSCRRLPTRCSDAASCELSSPLSGRGNRCYDETD